MRVSELTFDRSLALYRGDGGGAAAVRLAGELPTWAQVETPGAGIPAGFLYLTVHSSDIQVFSTSGDADAAPPQRTDADARFTALGAYFHAPDLPGAQARDAELAARTRASMDRIRSESLTVRAQTPWGPGTVKVGPTLAGETRLECHGDDGQLRLLTTIVPRHALERARMAPVTITVGYKTPRRMLGGMAARTAQITLSPASPAE